MGWNGISLGESKSGSGSRGKGGKPRGGTGKRTGTGKRKSSSEFNDVEVEANADDTVDSVFNRPTKERRRLRGEKTANYGHTGSGKTRYGMSWVRLNPKDVEEDITAFNLPSKKHDHAIETFLTAFKNQQIIRGDPIYVIGTEISTEECIYGDDNWDLFAEHVDKDILFKEVYEVFEKGPEKGELDPIASLRRFNHVWSFLMNLQPETGTVFVDSGTSVLSWRHSYLRRKIMKKAPTEKEQGVPLKYWFWRNEKQESFQLGLRALKANTNVTWKMAKDSDGDYTDRPRWHDDTSGHLSNNIIFHPLHEDDMFTGVVRKCRQSRAIRHKILPFPTATKFVGLLIHAFDYEDIKKLRV